MTPPTNDSIPYTAFTRADSPLQYFQENRDSSDYNSMPSSILSHPQQAPHASIPSLAASSNPAKSRTSSPARQGKNARLRVGSIFEDSLGRSQCFSSRDKIEDPRKLILQAFVPHIAVHTSSDTSELLSGKGFKRGLWELLRPFGEHIPGKVNVRDSLGAGKTWEDYAVHFVQLEDGTAKSTSSSKHTDVETPPSNTNKKYMDNDLGQRAKTEVIASVETLVDYYLTNAEQFPSHNGMEDYLSNENPQNPDKLSPFYISYLRKLMTGMPLAPHETFSHPVACVIAISSRNASPIDTLKELYEDSIRGKKRLPQWVNNDYLRYYVLIHDEERGDINKSVILFDQMKRHFGLHCHLLRLRSSQCVTSDDDSVELPRSSWLTAQEEITEMKKQNIKEGIEDSLQCIYGSDITAIRTFIREMVTQSIIPSMERCVATWNDQIASRRKGFSGRILSISKQWAGFGRSSRSSVSGTSGSTGPNSNYDIGRGYYRPDAPEALMRKLADYAFMLRDWKLALGTYDLLRSDFSSDKAWKYHAAANEMAAICALLVPRSMSSKTRSETIDQFLETASYSYITRCGASCDALRCLLLGMELLRLRGGSAISDAAKWGLRLLESKIVGSIGDALIKERISACYASKKGIGSGRWGGRTRKSALWNIQAADAWLIIGKPQRSKQQLDDANSKYSLLENKNAIETYSAAGVYLKALQRKVQSEILPVNIEGPEVTEEPETLDEAESEDFQSRPSRRSMMGVIVPPLSGLATTPLKGTFAENGEVQFKTGQFE
ncbi:Transport protein particle subunit trs85-2 [Golovinomyces cichoracearum]|uniref:Transport protein particle subunit trs85-2 n=1 Tax=Golovinomyces cichoracearum TaxID=62708 RepID=A0A420HCF0_9PEZI|nr:Transport protein particle subunit trs85-2 [Golovinomyces cichoracearum]